MSLGNRSKSFFLLILIVAVSLGVYRWGTRPSGNVTSVHFQLRKGLSGKEIARDLEAHGLLPNPSSFLLWVKIFGAKRIQPGIYEISPHQSSYAMYKQFVAGPPLVRVTFPEGWMAKQMAVHLETKGVCSAAEFLAIVQQEKLEGFLFPDTYFFQQETPTERVIRTLHNRYKEKEPSDFKARAKAMNLTPEQLVTLASLVEKEAQAASERPMIAGVFYNRLKKKMFLESCATVEYALGYWKPRLLYKDLKVQSPYNTYRHPGLPPGPICNPGLASLEAAAHPADTDALYFVADGRGTHRFSRYYKDHLHAKKKR